MLNICIVYGTYVYIVCTIRVDMEDRELRLVLATILKGLSVLIAADESKNSNEMYEDWVEMLGDLNNG